MTSFYVSILASKNIFANNVFTSLLMWLVLIQEDNLMKKQTKIKTSIWASIVSFLGINGDQAGYIMLGAVAIVLLAILAIDFAKSKKRAQNQPKKQAATQDSKVIEQPKEKVVEQLEQQPVVATVTPVQTLTVGDEEEVVKGVEEGTGLAIIARYKKSFMARLIQAPDEIKGFYSDLKNQILSYQKV